jgi:hypothetical protein
MTERREPWLTRNPAGRNSGGRRVEVTDFDALLRKEFKPKTDEAKEAVERPCGRWPSRRSRRRS